MDIPVGSVWRHPAVGSILTVSCIRGDTLWYKFMGEDVAVPVDYWLDCIGHYGLRRIS